MDRGAARQTGSRNPSGVSAVNGEGTERAAAYRRGARTVCQTANRDRADRGRQELAMTKLNVSDIQGFALRGYSFPWARYLLLEITSVEAGQQFVGRMISQITTGERWDDGKPDSTVNIAFTHQGLAQLGLP